MTHPVRLLRGVCECGQAVQCDAPPRRPSPWIVYPCPAFGCFRYVRLRPAAPDYCTMTIDTNQVEYR